MFNGRNLTEWTIPCSSTLVPSVRCSKGIAAQNTSALWTTGEGTQSESKLAAFPAAWHLKSKRRFELRRSGLYEIIAAAGFAQLTPFFCLITGMLCGALLRLAGNRADIRDRSV